MPSKNSMSQMINLDVLNKFHNLKKSLEHFETSKIVSNTF